MHVEQADLAVAGKTGPLLCALPDRWHTITGLLSLGTHWGQRERRRRVMVGPIRATGLRRVYSCWDGMLAPAAKILIWTEPAGRTFSATATMTMSTPRSPTGLPDTRTRSRIRSICLRRQPSSA